MRSLSLQLQSLFFKYNLRHQLQTLTQAQLDTRDNFGTTSRPDHPSVPANPTFQNGVATKDLHIDPFSSLSVRIFLPETVKDTIFDSSVYGGYAPATGKRHRKLPIMLQFHGGGFVVGSNDASGNDVFCRRMAKLCDVIVVAVGYRLAPESQYPAAFEDGMAVVSWLAKQANLAAVGRRRKGNGGSGNEGIVDRFGSSMVEPWLAAHGEYSRCVLLGVSCGANIADYVARKAVEAGSLLDPLKVVAQILMYPFFIGSVPTKSEIKLANSYFYDKATCMIAWKLFLPREEFNLDHPAGNPLFPWRGPPIKTMPPTLTIVAEHDWMRDRGIAYSEELRKANVDAPLLEYKNAVHEFATLDGLLQTPQALACADDITIWVKKYLSLRGGEFSY
ncbi:probable carboxylesterase 16 [Argentina anserina]|uniref:probable carboxylesterase 16 n=1 Tax=Argentina anserina TaxID=57926 RepID=UPI0021767CCC|nr:probable carboxylesterase 16 [Potentilla anserina]